MLPRSQRWVLAAVLAAGPSYAQIIGVDEVPQPVILTSPLPNGAVGLPIPAPLNPAAPQGLGVFTGGTPQQPVFVAPQQPAPLPTPAPAPAPAPRLQPPSDPASIDRLRETISSLEIQVAALRDMLTRAPSRTAQGAPAVAAFQRGREYADRRLYRAAIDAFSDAILLDPGNDSAFLLRAEAYQQLGDFPNAEADFTDSLEIQPNNSRAYLGRAAARNALGNVVGAFADLQEAATRDPQNAKVHLLRARLYEVSGEINGAIASYSEALNRERTDTALVGRASAYLRAGQFALAANDCEAARTLNPNAALAHLCLAEVHLRQNAPGQAVAALNSAMLAAQMNGQPLPVLPQLPAIVAQASQTAPVVTVPVAAPAPVVVKAPEPPRAKLPEPVVLATVAKPEPKPVAKVVAPKPAPPAAPKVSAAEYNRQARDLTNTGRYEDALDLLNKALDQAPKYAQAFNARGFVHLLMLNYSAAVADFTEAIRLKPDYANAFHNRAVALRKLSKTSDADADEKTASRFMAVVYPVQ